MFGHEHNFVARRGTSVRISALYFSAHRWKYNHSDVSSYLVYVYKIWLWVSGVGRLFVALGLRGSADCATSICSLASVTVLMC